MTCHEDNCPALCQFGRTMACDHYNVKRLLVNHECRCQGPALLKELVEAAIPVARLGEEATVANVLRLDTALSPFRQKP